MGIKDFSKIFTNSRIVQKDILCNKSIAIDAYNEIYRAECSKFTLTDNSGNNTSTINVILSNIIDRKVNNVNEIWVFDYHEHNYVNPLKVDEIKKRVSAKEKIENEIKQLENSLNCTEINDDEKERINDIITKKYKI